MAYAFNPFTSNLDKVGTSGGGSGATLTRENPSNTVDGVPPGDTNVFPVLHTPVCVEIDGTFRVDGYGYSYDSGPGEITVDPLLGNPTQSVVSFYNAT